MAGKSDRSIYFLHPKGALVPVLLALSVTAFPYLTLLGKLPFTRYEMRVLCWFPGYLTAATIWHLASDAPLEDILQTHPFSEVAQFFNVFLYSLFFYVAFCVVSWLNQRPTSKS